MYGFDSSVDKTTLVTNQTCGIIFIYGKDLYLNITIYFLLLLAITLLLNGLVSYLNTLFFRIKPACIIQIDLGFFMTLTLKVIDISEV
jgi:hypothetical protein